MAKTYPIDPNNPKGTSDPKKGDDQIRKTNAGAIEIINVDHYVGVNTPDVGYDEDAAGEHLQATLHARISPVDVEEDKGVLFVKTVDDVAELHFSDENEAVTQLTRGGKVNLDKNIIANDTPLQADNEAGDGVVDLIKAGRNEADDSDVMLLSDGARMDTDTPPLEDTGVVNKKYADDSKKSQVSVNGGSSYTAQLVVSRYITGTLNADSSSTVNTGVLAADVLSVNVICFDDNLNKFRGPEAFQGSNTTAGWSVQVDDNTLTIANVGTNIQGNAYRIQINHL